MGREGLQPEAINRKGEDNDESDNEEYWQADYTNLDMDKLEQLRNSLIKSKKAIGSKQYFIDDEFEEPSLLDIDTSSKSFILPWQQSQSYRGNPDTGPLKVYENLKMEYDKVILTMKEPKIYVLSDFRLVVNDFMKIELNNRDLVTENVHIIGNSSN